MRNKNVQWANTVLLESFRDLESTLTTASEALRGTGGSDVSDRDPQYIADDLEAALLRLRPVIRSLEIAAANASSEGNILETFLHGYIISTTGMSKTYAAQ